MPKLVKSLHQMPILRLVNNEEVEVTASVSEKHFKNIKKEQAKTFSNYDIPSIDAEVESVGNLLSQQTEPLI